MQKIVEGLGLTSGSILAFIADTNAARDASNQETLALIRHNAEVGKVQLALQREQVEKAKATIATKENELATLNNTIAQKRHAQEIDKLIIAKNRDLVVETKLTMAERARILLENKNLTAEQRKLLLQQQEADQQKINLALSMEQSAADHIRANDMAISTTLTEAETKARELQTAQKALAAAQAEKNAAAAAIELGVNAQNLTLTQAQNLESERQVIISKLKSQGYTEEAATEAASNIIKTKAILLESMNILMSKTATKEEKKEAAAKMLSAAMSVLKAKADTLAAGATGALTVACKVLTTTIYNIPIIG